MKKVLLSLFVALATQSAYASHKAYQLLHEIDNV